MRNFFHDRLIVSWLENTRTNLSEKIVFISLILGLFFFCLLLAVEVYIECLGCEFRIVRVLIL